MKIKFLILAVGTVFFTATFVGCNNNYNSNVIGYGTPSLIGPGDWNAYLNSAAGVIEYLHAPGIGASTDYIGIATRTSYTTGFDGLSMVSVGPQDNGSGPVGSTSYDLQISGFAYFWAPFVTAGPVQAMVPPVCPSSDIVSNFIVFKPQSSWSSSSSDAYGTMTFSAASGGTTMTAHYNLSSTTSMGSGVIANGAGCNAGQFTDGANETFVGPGNFLLSSSNGNYYFAVQQPTTTIAVSDMDGDYAGIYYQAGAGTNSPITVTLASGSGTATTLSDVSNSSGSSGPAISLSTSTVTGFFQGTVGGHTLVCLPQKGTSQNLLACVGEDSGNFISLILVSH